MSLLVDTFSNRLKHAITVKNIKPVELSRKTGISKTNISCYMSGKYEAKQDGVKSLAEALNVNPVWLMGYDVPMEPLILNESGSDIYYTDNGEIHFLSWPKPSYDKKCIYAFNDETKIFTMFIGGLDMQSDYFHIKIYDESMNLVFPKNKIIRMHRQNQLKNDDIGLFYVNNEYMIRKYVKNNNAIVLIPVTADQNFRKIDITNLDCKILGKAIINKNDNTIDLDETDIAFATGVKGLNETNKMIIKNTLEALLAKQEKDEEDNK